MDAHGGWSVSQDHPEATRLFFSVRVPDLMGNVGDGLQALRIANAPNVERGGLEGGQRWLGQAQQQDAL